MNNTTAIPFVNLHSHTGPGSIFDALGFPAEHMNFCYENGGDAMAITDHGNMNSLAYQVLHSKKMLNEGKNITIYDFDGPRTEDGGVLCLEVDKEMVKEKLNDIRHPFGHGYVVACAISDN